MSEWCPSLRLADVGHTRLFMAAQRGAFETPVGLIVILYTDVCLFAKCSIRHFPFLIVKFLWFVVGNRGSGTEGGPV